MELEVKISNRTRRNGELPFIIEAKNDRKARTIKEFYNLVENFFKKFDGVESVKLYVEFKDNKILTGTTIHYCQENGIILDIHQSNNSGKYSRLLPGEWEIRNAALSNLITTSL